MITAIILGAAFLSVGMAFLGIPAALADWRYLLVPAAAEKDALEGEAQRRIVGLHPSRSGSLLRREHARGRKTRTE